MKCPICNKELVGIIPLNKEEWICINENCFLGKNPLMEIYGITQKEINRLIKYIYPKEYKNRIKYRGN